MVWHSADQGRHLRLQCFPSGPIQRKLFPAFEQSSLGNAGNEELVFLANANKEGRKRRLKMQLALKNLAARRRRVLNLACLLLLLIFA